jgi:hypothetical protein
MTIRLICVARYISSVGLYVILQIILDAAAN